MKSKWITKQFAKKIHIIYIYRKKLIMITDAISSFSDFGLIHIGWDRQMKYEPTPHL